MGSSSKPEVSEDLLEELETLKRCVSFAEQIERVYEVVGEVQADGVGHAKLVPYDLGKRFYKRKRSKKQLMK